MTDFAVNASPRVETSDSGGGILLVKIGTHPKLTEIVPRLQQLLPQTRLYGIGVPGGPVCRNYQIVAQEDELLFGAFDVWWERQLFVKPDLYLKVLPYEGQLLRMTQRAIDHDLFSVKRPNFPIDKDFSSFESRRQLLLRQVAFWDSVLTSHKISAVVTQNLPHNFWDAVLHVVARARDVPFLSFHEVRPFMGSLFVYQHPSEMGNLEFGRSLIETMRQNGRFLDDSSSRRDRLLREVCPADLQKTRVAGSTRRPISRSKKIENLFTDLRHVIPKVDRSIRRRYRSRKAHKETGLSTWAGQIPDKYFLIELQPPSNATSLIKGFMYGDTRELIAHIANSLPYGYSLVVRESSRAHMASLPRRERFWQQVAALPSVVVVGPDINTDVLLRTCAGVFEVGYSTLILQALHLGTQVILLGHSHLGNLPGLRRVAPQDDLSEVLKNIVDKTPEAVVSSEELMNALRNWCDQVQASTLEGALSSFPRNVVNQCEYQERIVNNVSNLVATWYEGIVKSSSR